MCIWEYLKYVGTYVIFLDIKSYALTTFVLYQTCSVVKILHLNWPTSQWLTKKALFLLMCVQVGWGNYFRLWYWSWSRVLVDLNLFNYVFTLFLGYHNQSLLFPWQLTTGQRPWHKMSLLKPLHIAMYLPRASICAYSSIYVASAI